MGTDNESKKDDIEMAKKNGEDKNLANAALDDSIPKINPVKWTVSYFLDYNLPFYNYEKMTDI